MSTAFQGPWIKGDGIKVGIKILLMTNFVIHLTSSISQKLVPSLRLITFQINRYMNFQKSCHKHVFTLIFAILMLRKLGLVFWSMVLYADSNFYFLSF